MKFRLYKIFLILIALPCAVACTQNYEDINSHPYQPGDLTADDYLLGSAMNSMAGSVISPDANATQFVECLLGGPMGGYFADSNAAWTQTISRYNPTGWWTDVLLTNGSFIALFYTNYNIVKTMAATTGNKVPLAIADVIKVALFHRVCDTYGPVPYSKIGVDGSIITPYDTVEEAYGYFFEDLDAAIEVLDANINSGLVESADYIYSGKVVSWIKFANSLKLRLAMRLSNVDTAKAKEMAESAINHPIGVFTSNADNAQWDYFKSTTNPIYVAVNYNTPAHDDGTVCPNHGDAHAAADIVCYMSGYADGRLSSYFTTTEWESEYDYVGMRRGIVIPDCASVGHKYSGINISASAPLQWMNAAEVAFLKAEAVAVYGFDMGGSAQTFYEEGVRLSYEQWGASGVEEYLADDSSVPAVYTDPSGAYTFGEALSTVTVAWDDAASVEEKQERIIIQKWIANWMLGNEAWADYRRTGFPHLIPATEDGNASGGIVDSNRGARRLKYPQSEYTNNGENVAAAVASLGGPDEMSTDLWWAKKN